MKTTGTVTGIQQKVSKTGKPFNRVMIDTGKESLEIYDWQQHSADFQEGHFVEVLIDDSNERFPRLNSMQLTAQPDGQQPLSKAKVAPKQASPSPQREPLMNSSKYLSMKLASELVSGEQIAVDKKLLRFWEAYKQIQDEFQDKRKVKPSNK